MDECKTGNKNILTRFQTVNEDTDVFQYEMLLPFSAGVCAELSRVWDYGGGQS